VRAFRAHYRIFESDMSTHPSPRVWFITGSSTGFGRLLAEEALRRGDRVVATARDRARVADLEERFPDAVLAVSLDVTQDASIAAAAKAALEHFGRVDVLVNNAGYGLCGAVEEAAEAEDRAVIETNVFGLIAVTRAFLPHFREQGSRHIINLSSIGGLIGSAGWSYYNLTKFAVNGFSEGLAQEMKPFGVSVTVIEPGPFRTDFLGRSGQFTDRKMPEYDATVGKTREYFTSNDGKQKGDPQKAVEAIVTVVEAPQPPLHLILGKLAFDRDQAKLADWSQTMDEWQAVTLGADFPEGQ
jgi:NAD(P)-dependent dehydrogenase (short-subunit alcohol dehydrogenase family)